MNKLFAISLLCLAAMNLRSAEVATNVLKPNDHLDTILNRYASCTENLKKCPESDLLRLQAELNRYKFRENQMQGVNVATATVGAACVIHSGHTPNVGEFLIGSCMFGVGALYHYLGRDTSRKVAIVTDAVQVELDMRKPKS